METLNTILYFSIFKHPLTKDELFKYSKSQSIGELQNELNFLLEQKFISKIDSFYTTTNKDEIKRRTDGEKAAKSIMYKAIARSVFISKFPFIESVSLSGALSKGYYDDDGDIDFFIITSPKFLWIARTFLILYKKLFLLNSKKYFCVNYFISSSALEIEEKNQFTATELLTLIPITGKTIFKKFVEKNKWAKNYLPNISIDYSYANEELKKPIPTRVSEFLFNSKLGSYLNKKAREITIKKWQTKFNYLNREELKIAMKSTDNISKHHPQNFQKKVIQKWNEKINKAENKLQLNSQKEHV